METAHLAGSLREMNSTVFNFGTVLCQSLSLTESWTEVDSSVFTRGGVGGGWNITEYTSFTGLHSGCISCFTV